MTNLRLKRTSYPFFAGLLRSRFESSPKIRFLAFSTTSTQSVSTLLSSSIGTVSMQDGGSRLGAFGVML